MEPQPPPRKRKGPFSITGVVVIAGQLFFLLAFHIAYMPGKFAVFPKQHLTFSNTVVRVEAGVDERDLDMLGGKTREQNEYLFQKLKEKGFVGE